MAGAPVKWLSPAVCSEGKGHTESLLGSLCLTGRYTHKPLSSLPACSSCCPVDAVVCWWPWAEASGWRCPEPHDHDRCGGLWSCSHLGEAFMSSACAFPLFVLLPGGRCSAWTRRGTHNLWGVGAGYGEVQWFSSDLHTASTSHPALRRKHPLAVYCQDNLGCPTRLPNPGLLNSSGFARTGLIFMVSSCLSFCRAPEQSRDWSMSSLKEEG